jgi:aspartate racemase
MPRRLGILGGMGPEATVLLMSRIIAATPARDDADHVPMIVDNNTQVPSRIAALIDGNGADPAPVLAEMARKLQDYGAEALIMPCNTAHTYASVVRDAASVPFIDMVEASVDAVVGLAAPVRRLGVLASPATRKTAVFGTAFAPSDIGLIWPEDEDGVLGIIRHIKANGADAHAQEMLQAAADGLASRDVDAVLIGCTEFSLLTGRISAAVPIVDTLDVLVARAVAFALDAA